MREPISTNEISFILLHMTPPQFSTGSNHAYMTLGALAADQRWYAFDTQIESARKGEARLFVMTVWNDRDPKYPNTPRPIRRDSATGAYWYKVPREKEGERASQNRKSLWTGIDIAQQFQLPMTAVLKDRKSRKCSMAHTFRIGEVRYELDGSALWLKLVSRTDDVGAETENADLSHLITLPTTNDRKPVVQSSPPSSGQRIDYASLCEVAAQVERGALENQVAVVLLQRLEVDTSLARALLENYQCLVRGNEMMHSTTADVVEILADNIIALYGDKAVENVISAVKAYVERRANRNASELKRMCAFLEVLKLDWTAFQGGSAIAAAIQSATKNSARGVSDQASEILREVWVRGPQHAAFRRALKRRWKEACSVHGVACDGQLRASHIVAWSLDETLRGDPNNGLLLSVPLDSLFDRGMISFDDTGRLLRSKLLSDDTAKHFGVLPNLRLAWDDLTNTDRERIRTHLKRHRDGHAATHSYEIDLDIYSSAR